jgi:hypothetical protein
VATILIRAFVDKKNKNDIIIFWMQNGFNGAALFVTA